MTAQTSSAQHRQSWQSERLAPLDALRGLAALGVAGGVHYQHFGGDKATYPFASLAGVRWIYDNSWLLVDLFFVLSGIVMTHRYLEPLGRRELDGRQFCFLRLSRLFPLHAVALLICAAVQWSLMAFKQPAAIYPNNDLHNFAVQLLYLGSLLEHGWSFNEPSWSVSAEIAAYALFYLFARRYRAHYVVLGVLVVILGIGMQQSGWSLPILSVTVGRALLGFFVGSLGYLVMQVYDRRGAGARFGWACLAALVILCLPIGLIGHSALVGVQPVPHTMTLFPLLIFAALRVPPLTRLLSLRPLTFLGDISYAVYLMHVPIQSIVVGVARARHYQLPVESRWMLLIWGVALVVVGTVTHYTFELPIRRWLREPKYWTKVAVYDVEDLPDDASAPKAPVTSG